MGTRLVGGYARHGFWLEEPGGRRPMPVSYVDVVAGNFHLERGDFESTFAHEMGHVIVRTLVGDITAGRIRKQHSSLVVTDYPTAFDEGLAIHFECLVQDATTNPYLLGQRRPRAHDLIATWFSNVDGALRQEGVRRNRFVHRKALPALALEPDADRYVLWRDCESSAALLTDELKTGQAMRAAEGVGATLFYRLMTSPAVRKAYRDRDFYLPFLAPGEMSDRPEERFDPYENAALKVMAAMQVLGQRPFDPARPLLVELVQAYAGLFPDEAAEVYRLFLETTWGTTVSPAIASELEALARRLVAARGRSGQALISTVETLLEVGMGISSSLAHHILTGEYASKPRAGSPARGLHIGPIRSGTPPSPHCSLSCWMRSAAPAGSPPAGRYGSAAPAG